MRAEQKYVGFVAYHTYAKRVRRARPKWVALIKSKSESEKFLLGIIELNIVMKLGVERPQHSLGVQSDFRLKLPKYYSLTRRLRRR